TNNTAALTPTTTMASPVPPASSRSPMPPSPASPSCRSTLLSGLMGGLCVGAVAAVVLFICCGKKNRQRETAPSQNRQRETAPTNASTASAPRSAGKRIFTFQEVKSFTKDFSSPLGEGGSAKVYEGALSTGEKVAVKLLTKDHGQEFETEVEKLSRAHHKHVVSLVGYCIEEGHQILVYELVDNKTLKYHLHERKQTPDWRKRLKIALGSAKGLAYLHDGCHPKIIHRDIKANNILLEDDFEAKIADFGLAKCISESKTHVTTKVKGTFGYFAPEYFDSGKLTEKSDVFSFGVVLLELITGHGPRESIENSSGLVDWVRSKFDRLRKDKDFKILVARKLQNYELSEIAAVVRLAMTCVDLSAEKRPKMSK
ncbi:hypothetical protein EUGRSUZ_C03823, partial [Eucalyptus grandis]